MFHDSIIAAIRTGTATLVGLVIAFLVSKGFDLDDSVKFNLISALTIIFTGAYDYLVNILEKKVNPNFGYFLLVPKTPSYDK